MSSSSRIKRCLATMLLVIALLAASSTADRNTHGLRHLKQQNKCTSLTIQADCNQARQQFGCCWASNSCTSCSAPGPAMKHTNPTCDSTRGCTFTCAAGWGDCNSDINTDGCEADLSRSSDHCGACGNNCALNNAVTACVRNQCRFRKCIAPFADCDGDLGNGCEAELASSAKHCGACNNACISDVNVIRTCRGGSCRSTACPPGYANCNGDASDGCEADLNNDVNNCGACSNNCTAAPNVAAATCTAGTCSIISCAPYGSASFNNCDGNASNGCETLFSDCTCGAPQPPDGIATDAFRRTCAANCARAGSLTRFSPDLPFTCLPPCPEGLGDCDLNGSCETDITTVTRCGSCSINCTANVALYPNIESASCSTADGGTCSYTCKPGYFDCDSSPGCETQVSCGK